MSVNKVILIGNLGDDVKMHYFEGGGCVGKAPLATSYSYTNRTTGEKVSETEWHNVVFRNKGAEIVDKYTQKGSKLYVEGRIKTRKWTDQEGKERYATDIIVSDFKFLSAKDQVQDESTSQPAPGPQNEPSEPPITESAEDDLPF